MVGKTVKHYRIIEKLGSGGMGDVYVAENLHLKNRAALKFLPPHLSRDEAAKRRFIQEAQSASALNHPNVCTIYDIDEDEDGQLFMAMALYEGQSLKSKLWNGPLAIEEAVDVATQVAEGLSAAHRKGIVHRDVKPANIVITEEGRAVILDFGLAKLQQATALLTASGSTLGTVAYMSPEQARGDKVDTRTDIWSLGVVLYEMVTGQLPFTGDYDQAIVYGIVNEPPVSPASIRAEIPDSLQFLIQKALEKHPDNRHRDIRVMIDELRRPVGSAGHWQGYEVSIVVLPFEDISPGSDNEYFSDGLTEEIIAELSQVSTLRVISRTSAMKYKNTKKDLRTIGQELQVQYALEGSVRKSANDLRITAQLIDAASDAHLWAERYNGTLEDIFRIQEDVSRAIVDSLKLKLSPDEEQRIAQRPIDSFPVYDLYLKANAEAWKFTEEGTRRAIQYLNNALDIVGDNPLLYAGLAWAHFNLVNIGAEHEEYLTKAQDYVHKALELDPDLSKALVVLGWMHSLGDPRRSAVHLKKALETNPDDTHALAALAWDYISLGRMAQADSLGKKLMQIDPLDFPANWVSGAVPYYDGRYEEALAAYRRLYEMYTESPMSGFYYSLLMLYVGESENAFTPIDRHLESDTSNVMVKLGLILKLGVRGAKEDALGEITQDFERTCRRDQALAHHLSGALALAGATEESLDWLEVAIDRGFVNYPFLAERDSFLKNIRAEPRFAELMGRVKTEWEHTEI